MPTIEDRSHRNLRLNPRSHPKGAYEYNNPSEDASWVKMGRRAMLEHPERMLMADFPRITGPGDFANLGHAGGGSACLLAAGILDQKYEDSVVHSVDIDFKGSKRINDLIDEFGASKIIRKHKGSTDEFAKVFQDLNQEFVFVFFDADHCYEAVVKDFKSYSQMVKIGGFVAFHDTHQDFSHRAVEDTVAKNSDWKERADLHVYTIRVFERVA